MIDKVKALAAQNRAAKTEEEKSEIKKQMNSLKEQDPKAFGIALGYLVKVTEKKVEDLTMAEKFGEVTEELATLRGALMDMSKKFGSLSLSI